MYLRIPGGNAAPGKVTLNLQNRTVECDAYSEDGKAETVKAGV